MKALGLMLLSGLGQLPHNRPFESDYIPNSLPGPYSYEQCKEWYSRPLLRSRRGWQSKRLKCEFGLEEHIILLTEDDSILCVKDAANDQTACIDTRKLDNSKQNHRTPAWYALKKLYEQKLITEHNRESEQVSESDQGKNEHLQAYLDSNSDKDKVDNLYHN